MVPSVRSDEARGWLNADPLILPELPNRGRSAPDAGRTVTLHLVTGVQHLASALGEPGHRRSVMTVAVRAPARQ